MVTQDEPDLVCQQCGARLAPDLRYCLQCYKPVGATATRAHFDSARKITSTRRPDPTIVFSPEKHAAMVRQARGRRRLLIIAVSTIAIVATGAITLQVLDNNRKKIERALAREKAAERDLNALADALERFRGDVGRYPTNAEGLASLERRPAAFPPDDAEHVNYWFGPYLEHVPEVDPWGNDYVYKTANEGKSFEVVCEDPEVGTGSGSHFRATSRSH